MGTLEAWSAASAAFGLSQEQIASIVAKAFRLEAANPAFIQPEVRSFIPEEVARDLCIVPLRHNDATLVVATCDPLDGRAEAKLNGLSGRRTTLAVAGPTAILAALDRLYSADADAEYVLSSLRLSTAMERVELPAATQTLRSRASAVERIIRLILFEAVKAQAQELRLEPQARGGKVSFTVDGRSETFVHLPVAVLLRVMARLRSWYPQTRHGTPGVFVAHVDGTRHEFRMRLEGTAPTDPVSLALASNPAVDPEATVAPPEVREAPAPLRSTKNQPGESYCALVVDDEPGARLLLATTLRRAGFSVLQAADGFEALQQVRDHDVDVMLLDLMMPRMSGLEVLKQVRGTVRTAALPIIIVTASEDPDDKRRLLGAGANDYLQKPIDPPRVSERVKALLRRSAATV